ncbi:hypothetical protein PVAND_016782 [Polypedilum vanderplanki]|uniref:Uncharacterized protein n=1 Tax=Polypedilum vanderplanki TaxID=319348 RepID=A0A9J6BGF1_POLVA|nr:hypothetical protein PVAND_016782 [Polypedilum vanderplanki]
MALPLDSIIKLWDKNPRIRLLTFAFAIVLCFFFYGIMQEKIMRTCYGGEFIDGKCNGERFKYEMCLVFTYTTWNFLVARFLISINNRVQIFHDDEEDETHRGWYALCAVCNIGAILCSNMALRHINYPTQIIAKSCKPIPVMVLGYIIAKKHYTIQRYFFILILVAGVVLFNYKEGNHQSGEENSYLGLILVGISIVSGGTLGGIEERMRKTTKPRALEIMFNINLFSALFLSIAILLSLEFMTFYHFVSRYPEVLAKIAGAAFITALGQVFVFLTIANFGALPTSIATTTRKFFNVLVSVIFFGNTLITRQWIAVVIVFGALFADSFFGNKEIFNKNKENVKNTDVEKNAEMESLKTAEGNERV